MSYGLSFDETPAESVQRVRREQLEAAADGLQHGHEDDPVEAVPAKEAKKLSKLLGDDHDLTVLAEHVNDPQLHDLIAKRREELLEEARALGCRIYAERPKAFARRSRRYVDLAAA